MRNQISMNTTRTSVSGKSQEFSSPSKLSKDDCIKDAAYAVQTCRRYLQVIGVWRPDDGGKFSWQHVLGNLSLVAFYFTFGMRTIPMFIYMVIDAKGSFATLNVICRICFSFMAGLKFFFLLRHKRDIAKCIKQMEVDWLRVDSPASRNIMLDYARFGHVVTRICIVFTFSSGLWFTILPFFIRHSKSSDTSNNATISLSTRPFPVPSNYLFSSAKITPYYETIYALQTFGNFILYSVQVAACSVAVVVVMHACGQLNIIMKMINQLIEIDPVDDNLSNNFNDKLSIIVKHHVRVLRFISFGDRMLKEICLVDLGGCTTQMCLMGYFYLLEIRSDDTSFVRTMSYLSASITFIFDTFSYCYVGELLTQEYEKVGQIAYMIDWYRLSGKQSLSLCLIMATAQTPMTLTAGGMVQLSYTCFASVMKGAMGYLNMLRTVTE